MDMNGWGAIFTALAGGYVLGRVFNHKEVDIGRQKAASALMEQVDQLLELELPRQTKTRLRKVNKALQAIYEGEGDETLAQKVFAMAQATVSKTWELAKSPFTKKDTDEDDEIDTKPKKKRKKTQAKASRKRGRAKAGSSK